MLVLYCLTPIGYRLAHRLDSDTIEMKVVHYLARMHEASKEKIYEATGADSGTLAKLAMRGIIQKE